MLGLSETVGEMSDLFEIVDNKYKLYRCRGKSSALIQRDGSPLAPLRRQAEFSRGMLGARQLHRISEEKHTLQRFVDALSADYIPLSIIVNENMELQHIVGDTTGLFRLPSGRPINDISKMVTKELAIPMSTGIQKVYRSHKTHVFSIEPFNELTRFFYRSIRLLFNAGGVGVVDRLLSSRAFFSISAISDLMMGFMRKPLIPMAAAFCASMRSLNPVQMIMGMSGRMAISFRASWSPVITGMVMSEMTRSYPAGWLENASSASLLLWKADTW